LLLVLFYGQHQNTHFQTDVSHSIPVSIPNVYGHLINSALLLWGDYCCD